MNMNDPYGK
jgi:hypothetical protein